MLFSRFKPGTVFYIVFSDPRNRDQGFIPSMQSSLRTSYVLEDTPAAPGTNNWRYLTKQQFSPFKTTQMFLFDGDVISSVATRHQCLNIEGGCGGSNFIMYPISRTMNDQFRFNVNGKLESLCPGTQKYAFYSNNRLRITTNIDSPESEFYPQPIVFYIRNKITERYISKTGVAVPWNSQGPNEDKLWTLVGSKVSGYFHFVPLEALETALTVSGDVVNIGNLVIDQVNQRFRYDTETQRIINFASSPNKALTIWIDPLASTLKLREASVDQNSIQYEQFELEPADFVGTAGKPGKQDQLYLYKYPCLQRDVAGIKEARSNPQPIPVSSGGVPAG